MTRYFEDVHVNDELAPVEKLPTIDTGIDFFGRENPTNPAFGDIEAGKRLGLKGALVPGMLKMAWICSYVSEWGGIESSLLSIRVAYRRPDIADEPIMLAGNVVDKREEAGQHVVELEVVVLAEGQPSTRANVQVALPSREG